MNTLNAAALDGIELKSGSHQRRDLGMCVMEAVAYVAGERHTDHPSCACPVLAAFARRLNDATWPSDADRTRVLRPFVARLSGSRSTRKVERMRAFVAADWACRTLLPAALDKRGQTSAAEQLRALRPISDAATARAARDKAQAAAAAAAAAYAAYADAYAADAAAAAAAAAAREKAREKQAEIIRTILEP